MKKETILQPQILRMIVTMIGCKHVANIPRGLIDYVKRHQILAAKCGSSILSRQVLACIIIRWRERQDD